MSYCLHLYKGGNVHLLALFPEVISLILSPSLTKFVLSPLAQAHCFHFTLHSSSALLS